MKRNAQRIGTMLFTTLLIGAAAAHAAGDPEAGREKARGCAGCHGLDGGGRIPLADKTAADIEEQLLAYQSGARRDEIMNTVAKQLDEQDIADLAAYYASQ